MFRNLAQYMTARKQNTNQFFPCAGSDRTIMVSSHIWWVECIAYSLNRMGYNVLATSPLYLLYTDDEARARFDSHFNQFVSAIREFKVQLILGGNTTAMVARAPSGGGGAGEMLHEAAGVPIVHYWWDEPRADAPIMKCGFSLDDYLSFIRNESTLNIFWDIDVCEEMQRFFGVINSAHVPLGTTPELWPARELPMAQRPLEASFLGNCFAAGPGWEEREDRNLLDLARGVTERKLRDLDRPMVDCVEEGNDGGAETFGCVGREEGDTARGERAATAFEQWRIVGTILRQRLRYERVRALADRLGDKLVLFGLNWSRMGLKAQSEHTGIPKAADYYLTSKASLNLFGGCVHGGMPLRPYEIACSNGLIFTQYSRELPELFEPGVECVAFRDTDEMHEQLDRVLSHPPDFDRVIEAGRRRVLAEHTWEHRLRKILAIAQERFDLPWRGEVRATASAPAG